MVVYLDTSALIKLYVDEEEGRELVHEAVDKADMVATSTVAYAESRSGLARRFREGYFTEERLRDAVSDLDRDWGDFLTLPASNSLAREAGDMAERHALRGFDAIHLASAKRLEDRFEDLRFLAFDDRLTDAAKDADVSVYDGG